MHELHADLVAATVALASIFVVRAACLLVCHKCAVRLDTHCDFVGFFDTFRAGFRAGLLRVMR